MTWTLPKTWFAGELVTANLLNTHLRDNLNALHARPKVVYKDNACSYSTSSSTLVDVDSSNLSLSLDTTGGDVLVLVNATVSVSGSYWTDRVNLGVTCDGALTAVRPQVTRYGSNDNMINITLVAVLANLDADSHDFVLRWSVAGATSVTMTQVTMLVREIG
jgi:hypothetical protein